MTDNPYVPHLIGITIDSTGIAKSQVVATNTRTGETKTLSTDANKVVIFNLAEFPSGYLADDVIIFENVGASVGNNTITINSDAGGFQQATIVCAAAATIAVGL